MKNARTVDNNASALSKRKYTPGIPPKRHGSIMAGVLVYMMESRKMVTVWDGVDLFRTVHLADAIQSLRNDYGWPIERIEFPTYTPDGNIVWTAGYTILYSVIYAAYMDPNFRSWVQKVKVAQARKRKIDNFKAATINAYRFGTDLEVQKTNRFLGEYLAKLQ